MTGQAAAAAAPNQECAQPVPTCDLARLRQMLRPDFLAEAGWDPVRCLLAPPRDHPLLGLRACAVHDCQAGVRLRGSVLCTTCSERFRQVGVPLEKFIAIPSGKRSRGLENTWCRVDGCQRPSQTLRLCAAHARQRLTLQVSVDEFLARDDVVPRPSFGPCRVAACIRPAESGRGLCGPHGARWQVARRQHPRAHLDLAEWASSQPPIGVDHVMILKGLPERVQLELLLALQQRTGSATKTPMTLVRHVIRLMREQRLPSVLDLEPLERRDMRQDVRSTVNWITVAVRRALSTPELERQKDVWDLCLFGTSGRLDFTRVSQPWLREAAKRWAAEDLPRHRGRQASQAVRMMLAALCEFSESLRLGRDDQGLDPAKLSRGDVVGFTNRLAHKQRIRKISALQRVAISRDVRRFLDDVRPLGLTRPGAPVSGLGEDVRLWRGDVPDEVVDEGPGRALPPSVLSTILANLDLLEQRSNRDVRRVVEVLIDTGRRPDEICRLPWDCLDRAAGGKPVLRYTETKYQLRDRALPIGEDTARLINAQQQDVRARFPLTPMSDLVLFPGVRANPYGAKPLVESTLCLAHRRFIEAIRVPLVDDQAPTDDHGRPKEFNRALVVPYAYRHSYAQRHADSGVPVDVLRELMGHRSLKTTQTYYRVTELRVRAAVDRVSRHQFDGQGRRVLVAVTQALDVEHARARIGQVAVPFGVCTEPSNVKAGGTACPYRYHCMGCGHFRSDASYLPELKSYLQQLLADRERVLASVDLERWARTAAAPSEREIARVRELIRRIETDLDTLDDADRQQIREAVAVMRKARQVVRLGVPRIRTSSDSEKL